MAAPAQPMLVYPLRTKIIGPSDNIADVLDESMRGAALSPQDGDVFVLSSKVCALTEGERKPISSIQPCPLAIALAEKTRLPAGFVDIVLQDADAVLGFSPFCLTTIRNGVVMANSGADRSNAGEGNFLPLPRDPDATAAQMRTIWRKEVAVIITDSIVHPMRRGTAGVALAVAGMHAVESDVGKTDLFGHSMSITRRAVADNICTAAQILMGETTECTPFALVRNAPIHLTGEGDDFVTTREALVAAQECLFMGHALMADPAVQAEMTAMGLTPGQRHRH